MKIFSFMDNAHMDLSISDCIECIIYTNTVHSSLILSIILAQLKYPHVLKNMGGKTWTYRGKTKTISRFNAHYT